MNDAHGSPEWPGSPPSSGPPPTGTPPSGPPPSGPPPCPPSGPSSYPPPPAHGPSAAWGPPPSGAWAPPSPETSALVRELSWPLHRARGWLQFLAVASILSGVISALTIVGILYAWLPIWMGVLLFRTSERIEQARERGDRESLANGLDQLRTYFLVQGVIMLVGLAFTAIFMIYMLTVGLAGMSSLLNELG